MSKGPVVVRRRGMTGPSFPAPTRLGQVDPARDAVETVFRDEYGLVVASIARRFRDLELAEEVVQDALATALRVWPVQGVPDNPAAWITTAARRRAIDRLRRTTTLAAKTRELAALTRLDEGRADPEPAETAVTDDRLQLLFACCHPELDRNAQVALTLKTVGGLTTPEIARAFLVSDAAMYQRIVRAKRRLREVDAAFELPPDHELGARLEAVLAVVYLIFNEGYMARTGPEVLRPELTAEAIRLGRILVGLMPDDPEVAGLCALMLLHEARGATRVAEDGTPVPFEEQDRGRWDAELVAEGVRLLQGALRRRRPGPYQIQAAIAAVHHEAAGVSGTDWQQIAALYGELHRHRPTAVVALNHAAAVAMWRGPEAGLALMDRLGSDLDGYHLFHASRADLLRRLGRRDAAEEAYLAALDLAENQAERRFLERRLAELEADR